jgi:hypothetical protein
MTRTSIALSGAVSVLALTTACGSDRQTSVVAPSSAGVAARVATNVAAPSLLGTWVSASTMSTAAITGLPSLSTCGNFQWQLTSQTATQASGRFIAVCPGNLVVDGTLTGQLGGAIIPVTFIGVATQDGSTCAFSLSGPGTPLSADTLRIDYTGTTCLGPVQGSETLRLASTGATPIPAPTPTPAPSLDMINFQQAIIRDSPVYLASWPITTAIRVLELRPNGIHVEFSKQNGPGRWPDWTPPGWDGALQYSLGMALNIGGQWFAAAPIQFWYGLDQSGGPPSEYALNWFYNPGRWAPMTTHQPAVGETIGFFVCAGDCRGRVDGSGSPVKERSNVVLVRMPSNSGARYTF